MPGPVSSTLVCADFPQAVGNRMVSILDHKGPASYTPVTPGTPPAACTGGDILTAAECGLKSITAVSGQVDNTGTYDVEASMEVKTGGAAEVSQVALMWRVISSGLQAGAIDLHLSQVRLIVWGR